MGCAPMIRKSARVADGNGVFALGTGFRPPRGGYAPGVTRGPIGRGGTSGLQLDQVGQFPVQVRGTDADNPPSAVLRVAQGFGPVPQKIVAGEHPPAER